MKMKILGVVLIFGFFSACYGQQQTTWEKWSWLTGEWVGAGSGQAGNGNGAFSLEPALGGKVLIRKSSVDYPAHDGRPAVSHEDLLIVYPDNTGNPSRAIYFDNEGHTINYAVISTGKSVVMTSEKAAGQPVFRLTYDLLEGGTVHVKFEIAPDGGAFRVYTEGDCKRKA